MARTTIRGDDITDGTVVVGDIADDAVTTAKIINDAVTAAKIVANAVGSSELADDAVDTAAIADDAVTAAKIVADAVGTSEIADNSVSLAKMAGLVRGKIIYGDASGDPAALTVGTNGQALVSDGTDISWGSAGASSLNGLSDVSTAGGTARVAMISIPPSASGADYSVSIGTEALDAVTSGSSNVAINYQALSALTTGTRNIMIGSQAGRVATDADGNTGVGHGCFYQMTDSNAIDNAGFGYHALTNLSTGKRNSSLGKSSVGGLTTTDHNTGCGHSAGSSGTTISNCWAGGYSSDASAADASNEFTMGNASISNLRCNDTSISSLSDERDKTQIEDLPEEAGLEFINNLQPRTFYWDRRSWYDSHTPDGSKVKSDYKRWKANSGQKMGFVSQEVQGVISGKKYFEDSAMVSPSVTETDNGTIDGLEFAPSHLITPLVKAIQQLSEQNSQLIARIEVLEGN